MPVPNTNVTLSSIQTEFGGANPISLSEYYRGGATGYVPSGQSTSPTDGTPISTSGLIRIGMFRGLSKASLPTGGTWSDSNLVLAPNTSNTGLFWNTDGSVAATNIGGNSNWYIPTTTGIGSSYWIRFTLVSSTGGPATFTGTLNTWLALSSQRSIQLSRSATGTAFWTFTVEISSSSSGSPVVSTNSATLEAAVDF